MFPACGARAGAARAPPGRFVALLLLNSAGLLLAACLGCASCSWCTCIVGKEVAASYKLVLYKGVAPFLESVPADALPAQQSQKGHALSLSMDNARRVPVFAFKRTATLVLLCACGTVLDSKAVHALCIALLSVWRSSCDWSIAKEFCNKVQTEVYF